jgi:large subunit ribosomal protein L22
MAKDVTATAKYLRGSARKTRMVAHTIKGMSAVQALGVLKYMNKRAAGKVYKVVNSAVANAIHNENLNPDTLIIKDIRVNDAPMLKRFRAESKGRARTILKRNSHLIVVVGERQITGKLVKEKQPIKSEVAHVEEQAEAKPASKAKAPTAKAKTSSKSKKATT